MLLAAAAVVAFGLAPTAAHAQQAADCAIFDGLRGEAPDLVRRIQGGPRAIYTPAEANARGIRNWPSYLADGIVGRETLRALEMFCRDFPVRTDASRRAAMVDAAVHYAAIHDGGSGWTGPGLADWRSRLTADGFGDFLDAGTLADGRNLRRLRLAGTAPMVVRLLEEWRGNARPETEPGACTDAVATAALGALASDRRQALATLDGLLGDAPGTAAADDASAVRRFCTIFPTVPPAGGLAPAVAEAIDHFTAIETGEPRGLATLSSSAFGAWVVSDHDTDLPGHRLMRLAGTAPNVLALLDGYRPPSSPVRPMPAACRPGDDWAYYMLDADGLEALHARPQRAQALTGLVGEDYADGAALLRAVGDTVGPLDACNEALAEPMVAGAPSRTSWGLAPDATAALVLDLPQDVRSVVQPYAELRSASRAELEAAIARDLEAQLRQMQRSEAERYAGLVAARAETVRRPRPPRLDEFVLGVEPSDPPDEATDLIAVPDAARPELAAALPDEVFDAVEPLFARPFPSLGALQDWARVRIEPALAATVDERADDYLQKIAGLIEPRATVRLTREIADELATLPALRPVGEGTLRRVEPLADVAFVDRHLFEQAVQHPGNLHLTPVTTAELSILADAARRTDAPPEQPLVPFVADCGCVRPLAGEVYGFYPFWLQGNGDAAALGRIDLSLVSRLAYFGVRLAGTTDLDVTRKHWQPALGGREFLTSTNRHYTKADLAIQLDGWLDWSAAVVEQAAAVVAATAGEPFDRGRPTLANLFSTSVFDRLLPHRVDGVTLYFTGFAAAAADDDGTATKRIAEIVRAVAAGLPRQVNLNVAFDMPGVGEDDGPGDTASVGEVFLGLADLLGVRVDPHTGTSPQPRVVDLVLVFLERPTRDSKRRLHRGIEAAFAGERREDVLRMVVPVVPPNGHQAIYHLVPRLDDGGRVAPQLQETPYSQFRDDLSFFKDNFAGVGFWPPPLDDQAGYAEVIDAVEDAFWIRDTDDLLTDWAQAVPMVCDVVCPDRMPFRALLAALLLAAFVIGVVARLSCRFCTDVAQRLFLLPIIATLFFSLFFVVAVCDPWLRTEAFELLALMSVGLFVYIVVASIARLRREEDP